MKAEPNDIVGSARSDLLTVTRSMPTMLFAVLPNNDSHFNFSLRSNLRI